MSYGTIRRGLITLAITFIAGGALALEANQNPQQNSDNRQHKTYTQKQGTDDSPLVVKIKPTQLTQEEAEKEAKEHKAKAKSDWWTLVFNGFFTDTEVELIKRGTIGQRLCIWGAVSYEDVFGNPWTTNFCHSIFWIQFKKGKTVTENVYGHYASRHNDAT